MRKIHEETRRTAWFELDTEEQVQVEDRDPRHSRPFTVHTIMVRMVGDAIDGVEVSGPYVDQADTHGFYRWNADNAHDPDFPEIAHRATVAMIKPERPAVHVNQVWADNDKRCAGRHVLVLEVTGEFDARPFSARVVPCDATGTVTGQRATWIALKRFKPNSTGYRLVKP